MRRIEEQRRSDFDMRLWMLLLFGVLMAMGGGVIAYSVFPLLSVVWVAAIAVAAVLGVRSLLESMVRAGNAAAEWEGRRHMTRPRIRPRIGMAEAALVLFAALLIAGEVFAIANGFGAFFAVVSLGYFMAAGAAYIVFKRIGAERSATAPQQTAVTEAMEALTQAAATPVTPADRAVARQSDLLEKLTDDQADAVLARAQWTSVQAGARLAEAGVEGENVYIIVDGQVELTGQSEVGEVTVRIAGPGESFPLAALLGNGRLVTSATAMSDLLVYCIPRRQLMRLCSERPDIGMTIYAQVAEILADRYRSTLARHMTGVGHAVRQPEMWANF